LAEADSHASEEQAGEQQQIYVRHFEGIIDDFWTTVRGRRLSIKRGRSRVDAVVCSVEQELDDKSQLSLWFGDDFRTNSYGLWAFSITYEGNYVGSGPTYTRLGQEWRYGDLKSTRMVIPSDIETTWVEYDRRMRLYLVAWLDYHGIPLPPER
jgi:hypothetical protein